MKKWGLKMVGIEKWVHKSFKFSFMFVWLNVENSFVYFILFF